MIGSIKIFAEILTNRLTYMYFRILFFSSSFSILGKIITIPKLAINDN